MAFRQMRILGAGSAGASTPPANGIALRLERNIPLVTYNPSGFGSDVYAGGLNDVIVHTDGCLYATVEEQHVVLKIDPVLQQVTVYAGTWGTSGFAGDGDVKANALFTNPRGLMLSAAGVMYICDAGNNRVRKITANGDVDTFMGTGSVGVSGSGAPLTRLCNQPSSIVEASDGAIWVGCLGLSGDTLAFAGNYLWRVSGTATVTAGRSPARVVAGSSGSVYTLDHSQGNSQAGYINHYLSNGTVNLPSGGAWGAHDGLSLAAEGLGMSPDRTTVYMIGVAATGASGRGSKIYTSPEGVGGAAWVDLSVGSTSSSGVQDSSPPSDGSSGTTSIPETAVRKVADSPPSSYYSLGGARILVENTGTFYLYTPSYLFKYTSIPTNYEDPINIQVSISARIAANDGNTGSMLTSLYINGDVVNASFARDANSLALFMNDGSIQQHLWLIGSGFSNQQSEQLEQMVSGNPLVPQHVIIREMFRSLQGVYKADLLTRGGGEGTLYGIDAPRIRVENKGGVYLVERWLDGSTVNDYALLMAVKVGTKYLIYVGGIRDISTKGAAFVAGNSRNAAYSSVDLSNAHLVHVTYPTSMVDVVDFVPSTANCKLVRLANVSSTQPIGA